MILYVPGDAWTWNVAVRYADAGGTLLDDRERWTVRIGKGGDLAVERAFLGTMMDDGALVASFDPKPEILRGRVEPDGTLSLKDSASDPVAARVLRRLLNPDRTLTERLTGTSLVRHAVIRDKESFVPGSGLPASLRVEATLVSARLGGEEVFRAKEERAPLEAATPRSQASFVSNARGRGNRGEGGACVSRLFTEARRSHHNPLHPRRDASGKVEPPCVAPPGEASHGSSSRSSKGNHL